MKEKKERRDFLSRKPDLKGTWYQGYNKGDFDLFIEKKKKKNNKYLILGDMIDPLGVATFQGTISRRYIKFVKLYDLSALGENGAQFLYYKGRWFNNEESENDRMQREILENDSKSEIIVQENLHEKVINQLQFKINDKKKKEVVLKKNFYRGVYLFERNEESKKHINLLLNDYKEQLFEIFFCNEELRKEISELGNF
jgi:hypothetical protein